MIVSISPDKYRKKIDEIMNRVKRRNKKVTVTGDINPSHHREDYWSLIEEGKYLLNG